MGEPSLNSQCPNVKLGEWKCFPNQPGLFSTAVSLLVSIKGISAILYEPRKQEVAGLALADHSLESAGT